VLSHSVNQQTFPNTVVYNNVATNFGSRGIGATATQTLYNGFQTANRTRQAESQVMGARETLRVTEQQVLLDAATAYMNLLRDQAILDLNRRNVEGLTEQLKQTCDRFNVGEVTRTDVAQAESRLAAGRSALLQAQIELCHFASELPSRHWGQSWQSRTGHPGGSVFAVRSGKSHH
jgi:outer membrane protein